VSPADWIVCFSRSLNSWAGDNSSFKREKVLRGALSRLEGKGCVVYEEELPNWVAEGKQNLGILGSAGRWLSLAGASKA
jgi:hypothetical protein